MNMGPDLDRRDRIIYHNEGRVNTLDVYTLNVKEKEKEMESMSRQ